MLGHLSSLRYRATRGPATFELNVDSPEVLVKQIAPQLCRHVHAGSYDYWSAMERTTLFAMAGAYINGAREYSAVLSLAAHDPDLMYLAGPETLLGGVKGLFFGMVFGLCWEAYRYYSS